jgi:lipoteichoic acid synthase
VNVERLSARAARLARAASEAARRHPLLAIAVGALAVRQLVVSWTFAGRLLAPPNTLLVVTGLGLALVAPAFAIASSRLRVAALAAVDVGVAALLLAHLVYFRQFADLGTAEQVGYAGQGVEAGNALSVLLRPSDALFLAGGSLAALLFPRLARSAPLRRRTAAIAVATGLALFGAVLATSDVTHRAFADRTWIGTRLGPIGYTLLDVGSFAARKLRRRIAPSAELVAADAAALAARRVASSASPLFGAARGRNVIVVQLESVQAFTLDLSVGGAPVTPALHSLARESIRFDAFHAQVSQGNTSDAELATLCSLFPLRTGSVYFGYAQNDFRCLPELLREAGYTTAVLHGNRAGFWNRAQMYPAIGVERYHHLDAFRPDQPDGALSDQAFFEQALPLLEALPEPFHAVLITLTNHLPFDAPFVPRALDHGASAGSTAARYLDGVHYTDRELGRFVESLRRTGLLERSLLVVYGDHQGIGRRNSDVGELLGIAADDAVRWFETERRVPLLVRIPGGPGGRVVAKTGGQIDLAPTTLSLLGLSPPGTAFLGQDLLSGEPGLAILPNGSVASDDRVSLTADGGYGRAGCYARPGGARVPDAECAAIAARARAEFALSARMIELDTVARTAAASAPHGRSPVRAAETTSPR